MPSTKIVPYRKACGRVPGRTEYDVGRRRWWWV